MYMYISPTVVCIAAHTMMISTECNNYWWLVGSAEAFAPSSPRFMPFLGLSFANDTGKSLLYACYAYIMQNVSTLLLHNLCCLLQKTAEAHPALVSHRTTDRARTNITSPGGQKWCSTMYPSRRDKKGEI